MTSVTEQIVKLCSRFGLLREGIALALQGKSVEDAGCAQYASVSETKPQFRPARAPVGALVSTERVFPFFGLRRDMFV
jgi:hypothetical protein